VAEDLHHQEAVYAELQHVAHAQVLDDEQVGAEELLDELPAGAGGGGLGEVEGGAVEHGVAGFDGGAGERDGDVRLAGAGRPQDQDAGVVGHEAQGAKVDDEGLGDLGVEGPVEGVEGLDLWQLSLLETALEEELRKAWDWSATRAGPIDALRGWLRVSATMPWSRR
jgi:hypothetical protein